MNKSAFNQARELQSKLVKAQQELSDMTTEVSSGGGAVEIVIDGQQKVHSVNISPDVINAEDSEMLEDMVLAAINEALQKSQELAAKHLSSLTGGLKIPGLF